MEPPATERIRSADEVGEIVVYDDNEFDRRRASVALAEYFPDYRVHSVSSASEFRVYVRAHSVVGVILSSSISDGDPIELMQELKVYDQAPVVVMLAGEDDPGTTARIYSAGGQKCIVKHGEWPAELGPATRQLLRMARLVEENTNLIARLTEANVLLEEKNRRLDDFSASLAHDIRGPLGGISMKLDYVLESYRGELPERVQELLTRSYSSVQRLTDIVQAMYEYAKLGRQATRMAEVDLKALVEEVIGDLSFEDHIDIEIGLGALPVVWGNPDLLRRVFSNLISNAVKYCDKSPVLINIGVERYVESSLARFAEVFVQDNGPGIPEIDQREIFQMFARGASPSSKEGLGVGLAVVQRIVELHYGRIWLRSEPGKGTTFIMSLPQDRIGFIG